MTVSNPPATTTPAAFKTWAQSVADDVNAATTDIAALEDGYTATGEQVAPDFKATGKTGATTSPGILAGGTNTGAAPTTGAHVVGELVIGHDGKLWVCTAAGTPGTWVQPAASTVDDTAYDATSWNGVTGTAPSKNAVRDALEAILDGVTFTGDVVVPDEAYDATAWNGSLEVPTKNAVRDKIESLGGASVDDTAYNESTWNGVTATAPSKNAVRDEFENRVAKATFPVCETIALSDETTAITTGTAKVTWRAPWAFTLTAVRAQLNTASSSGTPTVDINESGTTILSTKLTIDANEKTSVTAATPAVISDSAIADDAELTFDIDTAGTGAKGLKVTLYGTRSA